MYWPNSENISMPKEMASMPAKVLLLEDQETTRKILAEVIGADPMLDLVASFDSVADGIAWLEHSAPDVLLVDLKLVDGLGIEVIRHCARLYPDCPILVLSASSEAEDVDSCLREGALGYLVKDDGLHAVAQAIRDMVLGGSPVSPSILRRLLFRKKRDERPRVAIPLDGQIALTKRELAVLNLIAQGLTYEETARQLCISVLTVQNYIKRLYRKLAVRSRGQAVFEAQRRGLL
jgi:DNA-binding NarL/FixJ family response regulator